MNMKTAVLTLILAASLAHLVAGAFFFYVLDQGGFQDADHWFLYSEQVVAQISLLTIGGSAGVLASISALWRPRVLSLEKLRSSTAIFLMAAIVTAVSLPLGWGYWVEFGANPWVFGVVISSIAYSLLYLTVGTILFVRWRRRSGNRASRGCRCTVEPR